MLLLLRRFLVVVALMFWQGGFFFYASVVVPVGTEVFGRYYPAPSESREISGKRQQGRITRTVARWLNVSGAVALVPLGWDLLASTKRGPRRRWRGLLWSVAVVLLVILFGIYAQLDSLFNRETLLVAEEERFHLRHRVYLWLCAVQWGCCLLYLFLTLGAWRAEDAEALPVKRNGG